MYCKTTKQNFISSNEIDWVLVDIDVKFSITEVKSLIKYLSHCLTQTNQKKKTESWHLLWVEEMKGGL